MYSRSEKSLRPLEEFLVQGPVLRSQHMHAASQFRRIFCPVNMLTGGVAAAGESNG